MPVLTKRCTIIREGASKSYIANLKNITDNSDTTYGIISKPTGSTYADFVICGFDFTEIPDGSVINSFSLKSYCGLDSGVTCSMFATRKYINGSYKDSSGNPYGGVTCDKSFGSSGTLTVNEITENAPFSIFSGFSAEDINKAWTGEDDYTGIAFYMRYRGLSSSTVKAYPRYYDLTVDYTLPSYTAVFKNYDGTVLQTVSVQHGSVPQYSGVTPVKPQDKQYRYSFIGWSPETSAITEDAVYTAQYLAEQITYTVDCNVSPSDGGTVTDGGVYTYGTTVKLNALANSGYAFKHWLVDGAVSSDAPEFTLSVTDNTSVTAVFEKMSRVYSSTKTVSVYCGTKRVSVYCGTKKLT